MIVVMWPLDKIKPYGRNPRKIPRAAVAKVAISISEFGWRQPIVVDEHGVILVGHVRRLAALDLKLAEAPVHVAAGLTPAQCAAYRLMDNRSGEQTDWNIDLLIPELRGLEGIDLNLTGFDVNEIDKFLSLTAGQSEDGVPAVPAVAASRLGDLWLCGGSRVLCGSCLDPDDVARALAGELPILIVTDPPYGIELDSEWRDRAGLNGRTPAEPSYMRHRVEGHTETTISGDTRADWSEAFALVPSLEVAYVWHASLFTNEVLDGLLRIGFLYPQQIIWNKGRTVLTRTHYWFQHEPCWYVRKKNAPWYGKAGENSTIWDSPSPKFIMGGSDEEKFDHPTQKPVALMRRPIMNHLKRGELVYDPFLGSGTTLAAATTAERRCCGTEIEPKYVDVVVQRWQQLTGQQATLSDDGRTYAEVSAERKKAAGEPAADQDVISIHSMAR
jgi:DNA modification methylase